MAIIAHGNHSLFSSLFGIILRTQFRFSHYASKSDLQAVSQFEQLVISQCKSNNLTVTKALGYFNSMVEMRPLPSIWAFNPLFGSLMRMNHCSTVVSKYRHLMMYCSDDFRPDICTLNIIIKCCCRLKNAKLGFSILATMFKSGVGHDLRTLSTLLDGLCKEGSVTAAIDLFNTMVRQDSCDGIVYATIIGGLCKAGKSRKALELLMRMLDDGKIKPAVDCFSPIIDSLCKAQKMDQALGLYQDMISSGVDTNIVCCNALIDGLCRSRKWNDVAMVLEDMKAQGVSPDISTFNSVLDGRFKEGNTMEAVLLVGAMVDKGLFPDSIASSSVLAKFCHSGLSEEAKLLRLDDSAGLKVTADAQTLNIVLNGLSGGSMMLEAQQLFEVMIERGQVDGVTYNTMINGHCLQGEMDKAKDLIDDMARNNIVPDIITYSILANGYVKVQRIDEALKIMKGIILKGFRPDARMRSILKAIRSYKREAELNNSQHCTTKTCT